MSICSWKSRPYRGQRLRTARQGTLIASRADGVSGLAQALLGATFLGARLLLHHQRQHHGRRHTSVSSRARTYRRQPVVIQFFLPGIAENERVAGLTPPHCRGQFMCRPKASRGRPVLACAVRALFRAFLRRVRHRMVRAPSPVFRLPCSPPLCHLVRACSRTSEIWRCWNHPGWKDESFARTRKKYSGCCWA